MITGVATNELPALPPPPLPPASSGMMMPLGRQRSYTVAGVQLGGPGGIGSLVGGGGVTGALPSERLTAAGTKK